MLTITRKDIINDDTGVFTRNAQYMGRMAMIAKQRAFFELLLSNPSSYFSSGHGNYLEGSGEAFGVTGLKNLVQKFYDQTDSNGDPVSIMPAILLVPTALRFSADQLINSPMLNGTTTANSFLPTANPHAGKYRVESSPWLNAQNLTGSSSLAYYLLANPPNSRASRFRTSTVGRTRWSKGRRRLRRAGHAVAAGVRLRR